MAQNRLLEAQITEKSLKNRFAPFRVFSPLWAQQNGIDAIPGEKLIFSGLAVEPH